MQPSAKIKRLFGFSGVRSSSHILVEQIFQSLRLQPVSYVSQIIGMVTILVHFWHAVNRPLLIVWASIVVVSISAWINFRRKFASDGNRETNVRKWLSTWMWLSVATGVVWGFAGAAFLILQTTISQVVLVAVIVAVVFASWPAFACWLPSLTIFTLTALSPMLITLATAYNVGSAAAVGMLIVVTCFVLYSGRRLNEIVVMAVTRNVENERLVARLKSEKQLAESARKATAEASRRRAKFFAGANHDLRQPLQAMGIYLQILQMQATPETKEVITQLDAAAKNISTLVEQLLEVSRIETGHLEVKMENVRVESLLADLKAEFEPVALAKGLQFSTKTVDAVIKTDPTIVARILRNLITNAIRYTSRPGGKIVVGARQLSGDRLTIGVYDEGPGIDRGELGRIFDAFYRGSVGKSSATGFGLGLSIVRGLAIRLSIPITVGSRHGKGSVFRLEFSLSSAGMTVPSQAAGLSLVSELDVRGVVGVLEDNDIVRDAVSAILKSWGATVVAAQEPNGQFIDRMVAEAQTGNLSALISDYNLGDGAASGLETIFAVRNGAGGNVPCVLLTAVAEDEIRAAYRRLCLNPDNKAQKMPVILQKPANAEALASALRRAVAENRRN